MWRKCIKNYTENQKYFYGVMAKMIASKTITEEDHEDASHNHKRPLETTSKRQEKEEEVETLFCELRDKHSGKFSVPQLRLWERMVATGIHDDLEEPLKFP